ncbi:hypothetical protein DVH24_039184 [Malus domestica]|uniref:Uncharacterized protein n=1 Tax=Malus domestica TaxID=3750 RepID=A0A498K9E0_MALDO|nr:hypothetical protein DVH24_039184 [Malus domestica]
MKAMRSKLTSMEDNGVWELVEPMEGIKPICCIYRTPLEKIGKAFNLSFSHNFTVLTGRQLLRAMVFFKCFKGNTITILAKEGDSQYRGTMLKLYVLLTGPKGGDGFWSSKYEEEGMHVEDSYFESFAPCS